jgi:hypothetical protein
MDADKKAKFDALLSEYEAADTAFQAKEKELAELKQLKSSILGKIDLAISPIKRIAYLGKEFSICKKGVYYLKAASKGEVAK